MLCFTTPKGQALVAPVPEDLGPGQYFSVHLSPLAGRRVLDRLLLRQKRLAKQFVLQFAHKAGTCFEIMKSTHSASMYSFSLVEHAASLQCNVTSCSSWHQ